MRSVILSIFPILGMKRARSYIPRKRVRVKIEVKRGAEGIDIEDFKDEYGSDGDTKPLSAVKVESATAEPANGKVANRKASEDFVDEKTVKPPANWRYFIDKVREMRAMRAAPVDTLGCFESLPENVSPKTQRFQRLVGLMLSSQTKDTTTSEAIFRLREKLDPFTPETVVAAEDLESIIKPVGFYRRKAVYLKETSAILLRDYDGDIPRTVPEMCKLPGVGPKMAHLLLQTAWGESAGIGVDTHVHRLAQWWHWVPRVEHSTPEKTRVELEKWLPRDLWTEINPLLVGFGQTWCPSRSTAAKCSECLLGDVCPASLKK